MSIVNGITTIIDDQFKDIKNVGATSPHYKNKESYQMLCRKPPSDFNAYHLIVNMLLCIERNWLLSPRRPSKENWRFKKQLKISPKNKLEKLLEKTIAKLPGWVNQVPTASGLIDKDKDKKRSIDLVRKLKEYEYEFIELKVKSDTPLFAAMEALQYAVLYIFSRLYYSKEEQSRQKLLQAETIHLIVLAPHSYYDKCNLEWLEQALNNGLRAFIKTQPSKLEIDFQFKTFPQDFNPASKYRDEDCGSALERIKPVYG